MGPAKPHGIQSESGVILPITGVDPHIWVHCACNSMFPKKKNRRNTNIFKWLKTFFIDNF
jgi:hypothetical protein